MYMLRLVRVSPIKLGSIFGLLGPIRSDSFVGQLAGYNFLRLGPTFQLVGGYGEQIMPQPYIWGHKMSFKPTPNLEFGVGLTTIFGGRGLPLTFGTFLHTFSSKGNNQAVEPGDRRTSFDFAYKVPGLRDRLMIYAGSMAEDEISPLGYPRRSAMNPGLYLTRIPGLNRLDLRVEGIYTNLPGLRPNGYFYQNAHYASGYRNYGEIIGSWVGRQGTGLQAWSTYHFSARNTLQFGYRHQLVDKTFIGGGRLHDASVRTELKLSPQLGLSAFVQYENWRFPVLAAAEKANLTASVQLTFWPTWKFH
jgi:hypothetical protein